MAFFTPNSHGDTHHMLEKWSDEARAAAAESRRRKGGRRSEQDVLNRPLTGPYRKPARNTLAAKGDAINARAQKRGASFWQQHSKSLGKLADKALKDGDFHRSVDLNRQASRARSERSVLNRPLTGPYQKPARRRKPHIGF